MKPLIALFALALLLLAGCKKDAPTEPAAASPTLTGSWKGYVRDGNGAAIEIVYGNLLDQGGIITGTGCRALVNGEVDSIAFHGLRDGSNFNISADVPGYQTAYLQGTLTADGLTGVCQGGGIDGYTFTASHTTETFPSIRTKTPTTIDGTWKGSATGSGGTGSFSMTVTQAGGAFGGGGTFVRDGIQFSAQYSGTITFPTVAFTVTILGTNPNWGNCTYSVGNFSGSFGDSNTIAGTVSGMRNPVSGSDLSGYTFTISRQ